MDEPVVDRSSRRRNAIGLLAIAAMVVIGAITLTSTRHHDARQGSPMPCRVGATPKAGEPRCTFAEEFSGNTLDRNTWLVRKAAANGIRSGACQVDSPETVSVESGHLNLTVRREANPFVCSGPGTRYVSQFSSGSVGTWKTFSQTYGRFEIRAKFPAARVAGLQSALWLYPQTLTYGPWPRSGEIDIAESYSRYADLAIPSLHYINMPGDRTVTNRRCKIGDPSAFHIYAAVWTRRSITITYDGKTCLVHRWNPAAPFTSPAPFDRPFIVLLSQGLGINDNAYDPARTQLPATTEVDYVHVWS